MTNRQDAAVLILSTALDVSTGEVTKILDRRGVRWVRVDTESYPFGQSIGFTLGDGESILEIRGDQVPVSSVWYRRIRVPPKPDSMAQGIYEFCIKESRPVLIAAAQISATAVMSAPEAIWAAENKVRQLHDAASCGLRVPKTYITNDPVKVLSAFREFNGEMIAKPVRTGYIDLGDQQLSVYTSKVEASNLERVGDAAHSPVIYQPLIPKKCDVRVTVVGRQVFVAEIDSQSDPAAVVDWRATTNPNLPHRRGSLPDELQRQILALMSRLKLNFAAIDFVLDFEGNYIFLEVNPNGQWQWLDDILELGISEAIAEWHVQSGA